MTLKLINRILKIGFNFWLTADIKFYQKNWEREFVYTLQECCVEVYLDGYAFDCVIQTKDFPRSNITQNPLVGENFNERFFRATNIQRIDMVVNLLYENAKTFLLK